MSAAIAAVKTMLIAEKRSKFIECASHVSYCLIIVTLSYIQRLPRRILSRYVHSAMQNSVNLCHARSATAEFCRFTYVRFCRRRKRMLFCRNSAAILPQFCQFCQFCNEDYKRAGLASFGSSEPCGLRLGSIALAGFLYLGKGGGQNSTVLSLLSIHTSIGFSVTLNGALACQQLARQCIGDFV